MYLYNDSFDHHWDLLDDHLVHIFLLHHRFLHDAVSLDKIWNWDILGDDPD